MRQSPAGIHHQQQHINPLQRRRHLPHHLSVQRRSSLMQSRRINKHNLPLRLRHNSLNPVPRRLRLRSNNRHLLHHQPVHQRGLPRVPPSNNGHKPRLKSLFRLCVVLRFRFFCPQTLAHFVSASSAHTSIRRHVKT